MSVHLQSVTFEPSFGTNTFNVSPNQSTVWCTAPYPARLSCVAGPASTGVLWLKQWSFRPQHAHEGFWVARSVRKNWHHAPCRWQGTNHDCTIRLHADDNHKSVTGNRERLRHHLKTSHALCPPVQGSPGDTLEVSSARLCQLKGLYIAECVGPQTRHLSMGNTASPLKSNILANHLVPNESAKVTD